MRAPVLNRFICDLQVEGILFYFRLCHQSMIFSPSLVFSLLFEMGIYCWKIFTLNLTYISVYLKLDL